MDMSLILLIGIFLLGFGSLIGFFLTKKGGFGKFNTSILLILLALTISATLLTAGKITSQVMANILFAVIGFAGGLFTGKE